MLSINTDGAYQLTVGIATSNKYLKNPNKLF
jgi:hypothetical protein